MPVVGFHFFLEVLAELFDCYSIVWSSELNIAVFDKRCLLQEVVWKAFGTLRPPRLAAFAAVCLLLIALAWRVDHLLFYGYSKPVVLSELLVGFVWQLFSFRKKARLNFLSVFVSRIYLHNSVNLFGRIEFTLFVKSNQHVGM